jgi:hypothetical protein
MKKQILSEQFKRMQFLAGIITESEMWDRDASHRDTYGDYNDERNYEEEEEDYADAEIVKKKVSPRFPEYSTLIDDKGDEYFSYQIFNTKAELEKAMKDPTYGPKAGYYNLPDGRVAVAFPSSPSKGEDFGGM